MKEEKFKIVQFIRELILAIDKQMDNFPKKDIEIKNRLRKNSFDMLELAYKANSALDINLKKQLILDIISKAKVIDFLLNLSYDKQIITEKKYYKLSLKLDDIIKYSTGWLKTII